MSKLIQPTTTVHDIDGKKIIQVDQHIPDDQKNKWRDMRDESMSKPMGETHSIAKIPWGAYLILQARGFKTGEMDAREFLKLLKAEGLEDFITTKRTI
jgi:hypothetical protein